MDFNWLGVAFCHDTLSSETREMVETKMEELREKASEEFDTFLDRNGLEQVMGVIVPKGHYDKKRRKKMNNIKKLEQLLSTDMSGCEGVYEREMAELLVNRFAENFGLSLDEVEMLAKAKAEGRLFVSPVKVGDNVYYETYENGESVGFKPHAVQNVNLHIHTDYLTDVTEGAIGVSVFLNEEDYKERLVPAKVENWQCPCCGRKLHSFEANTEYCPCCHQRFDWSEE